MSDTDGERPSRPHAASLEPALVIGLGASAGGITALKHFFSNARHDSGVLVALDEQDRARWDKDQLAEGRAWLARAVARRSLGPYVIQAAIGDLHTRQPRDWAQIAVLYELLHQQTKSPVVALNRAVAVAETDGPQAALTLLDDLPLESYPYYHSTRGELLRRIGRPADARAAFARALELTHSDPERRLLERRIAETTEATRER